MYSFIVRKSNSKPIPLYRDLLREEKVGFFYEHIIIAYI